jgi:hypothetical protein
MFSLKNIIPQLSRTENWRARGGGGWRGLAREGAGGGRGDSADFHSYNRIQYLMKKDSIFVLSQNIKRMCRPFMIIE